MYGENAALLKQLNDFLYYKINKTTVDSTRYHIMDSKIGCPTIRIVSGEKGIYLHSIYNPLREAEIYIEEQYAQEISEYIVAGFGFGYHIQKLLEKSPDVQIYIIESNLNVFRAAMENINLRGIFENNNISIFLEEHPETYANRLEELLSVPQRKLLVHLPTVQSMDEDFTEVKYLLEEYRLNKRAYKSALILEENFHENINRYNALVNNVFGACEDIPIIIVSAGPSLDQNVTLLKKAKGKAIILAVGRAVKTLLKAGVEPDLIIITDPKDTIYKNQLENINITVPIIVLATGDKNVMKNYKGLKMIAFQEGYELSESYAKAHQLQIIQTGGSVATTALDVAIKMGGNPIIFVGQDLALTDGRFHAKDATASIRVAYTRNLRAVEDVYGNTIYTTKNLYMFLKWIERRIAQESGRTFIDATEGGAKIEGTNIMKLQDVLESLSEISVEISDFIHE